MADQPDQIGRFRIRSVLGRGAMGVVYLAEDPVLGREVAIKAIQLHPGLSVEQIGELRQRFETEARAAAKLAHPNLVTIFDAGLEEENLYIAMEWVDGDGLDAMLTGGTQLSTDEVSRLIGQLASALDYAHGEGIVHRDIKPANVLLSKHGQAKITDFGVARQAASTLTATGAMIGTPAYMSPEQVKGEAVSGASDQFSLAIMAYELLTGERPFAAESATTILYKIVHEPPQEPRLLRPDLGEGIDSVILRAMHKEPEARYPNCAEFSIALSSALGAAAEPGLTAAPLGSAERAAPSPGLATDPDAATSLDASTGGTSTSRASTPAAGSANSSEESNRLPLFAAAGGAALVLVLLGVWLFGGGEETADPVPEPTAPEPVVASPEPAEEGGEIEVGADSETATEAVETAPAPVTYRLTSRPSGARVMFDGELLAERTPVLVEFAPDTEHTVLLELVGHETVSWRFVADELPTELQDAAELFFPMRANAPPPDPAPAATPDAESDEPVAAVAPEPPPANPFADDSLPPVDPIRVRGSMQAPELTDRGDPPEMPQWAIDQGLQRYVILELVIDREGRIRDARALQAVHPELEALAISALAEWEFEPAERDGEPVDVYHNVSVQFADPDEDAPGPA